MSKIIDKLVKITLEFFNYRELKLFHKFSLVIFFSAVLFLANDLGGFTRRNRLDIKLGEIIMLKQIDPDILKHDALINKEYLAVKDAIADNSLAGTIVDDLNSSPVSITTETINVTPYSKWKVHDLVSLSAMSPFYLLMAYFFVILFLNVCYPGAGWMERIFGLLTMTTLIIITFLVGTAYKNLVGQIPVYLNITWLFCLGYILGPGIVLLIVRKFNQWYYQNKHKFDALNPNDPAPKPHIRLTSRPLRS
jgi:hypothetical protein